jgi:uncharacterized protein (TIGR02300 family)
MPAVGGPPGRDNERICDDERSAGAAPLERNDDEEIRVSNPERGTKRTDPDTGKKFYDLNQDPVVSPYTGKSYPLSFFEQAMTTAKAAPERARPKAEVAEVEEEEVEETTSGGPEIVSLEEADAEDKDDDDNEDGIPEVEDVEVDEELGEDDDDAFLEDEDDENEDFDIDVSSDDDR